MRNDGVRLVGDTVSMLDRGDTVEGGVEVVGGSRFGVVMFAGFCIVDGDCGTRRSGRNSKRYFAVRGGDGESRINWRRRSFLYALQGASPRSKGP